MIRRLLILLMLVPFLATALLAERATLRVTATPPSGMDALDYAGNYLRQAINACEAARTSAVPTGWTRIDLSRQHNVRLAPTIFLLLLDVKRDGARVMLVDDDGPHQGDLRAGEETTLGGIKLIFLFETSPGQRAEFLVRAADEPALLLANSPGTSRVKITGLVDQKSLVVEAPDQRTVDFAEAFIRSLNSGKSPEEAARAAWKATPPPGAVPDAIERINAGRRDYTDPRNIFDDEEGGLPVSALVSVAIVRGESASIQALASQLSYDSRGGGYDGQPVRIESGPAGGSISVGGPGDSLSGRIRMVEAGRNVQVEAESMVRVPIDGAAELSIRSASSVLGASIFAERSGRNAVTLDLRHLSGDWSQFGSVASRVRVRDGQTLLLAKNTYQRSSSSSSGVPILQDIPYAGPIFGAQSRTNVSQSYAIFVSVALD